MAPRRGCESGSCPAFPLVLLLLSGALGPAAATVVVPLEVLQVPPPPGLLALACEPVIQTFCHCHDALTTRQKLIAQDYKVSYSLAKSCKSDLKKYRCNVDNLPRSPETRLSYLLTCLESAVHRGMLSRPSLPISDHQW